MPRKNLSLVTDASQATGANQMAWRPTEGSLNSVYAAIDDASTSATIEVYVANASTGPGVLIATMSLTTSKRADGFSLPKEDSGWFFVGAKIIQVTGAIKTVSACVGE